MGLLVILVALALWIWWSNRSDPPQSPSIDVASASPSTSLPSLSVPQPIAPLVAEEGGVKFPIVGVHYDDGVCAVCRSARPVRFATPRVRLCQWCITMLGGGAPFDITSMERVIWRSRTGEPEPRAFLHHVLNRHMLNEVISRRMIALHLPSSEKNHGKDWLRVMRAYHLGILSGGARLSRPPDDVWEVIARDVRRQDRMRCLICGKMNEVLHVHHMIPLSEYGTNHSRNLVTLCYSCHRAQHPNINFSIDTPVDAETTDTTEESDT